MALRYVLPPDATAENAIACLRELRRQDPKLSIEKGRLVHRTTPLTLALFRGYLLGRLQCLTGYYLPVRDASEALLRYIFAIAPHAWVEATP